VCFYPTPLQIPVGIYAMHGSPEIPEAQLACLFPCTPLSYFLFLFSPLQHDAQVHTTTLIHQTRLQCLVCLHCWCLKHHGCGEREGSIATLHICDVSQVVPFPCTALSYFLFLFSPLQHDAQVHTTMLIHQTRLQCLMCLQCQCLKHHGCGKRERGVAVLPCCAFVTRHG